MKCKDISELLTAYLDNEVTPEEREQIQAHLSACPHCREELEVLAATQSQLRRALESAAAEVAPTPQAWAGIERRLVGVEQPRVTILGLAKSKAKGGMGMVRELVSRQPVWRTAVVGVLAVVLIAGAAIAIPSLTGQSAEALAAGIARNDSQVQAAFGDGQEGIIVMDVEIIDNTGYVILRDLKGQIVTADVDMKTKEVIMVEEVPIPEFTEGQEEEAISIAQADPRVQELLERGAIIKEVFPFYSPAVLIRLDRDVEVMPATTTIAAVVMELGEETWVAHVDLAQQEVRDVIKWPSKGEVQVEIEELVMVEKFHMELTEAQEAQAVEIARSDPRVQELLNSGATIFKVMPIPSRVEIHDPEKGEGIAFIPDGKCAGVALRAEGDPQDEDRSWFVEVSLAEGRVIDIVEYCQPKSERVKPVPELENNIDQQGEGLELELDE